MGGNTWVTEFMKSVGRSTLNDLLTVLESDIAECNVLSSESGQGHVLQLDEGEPATSYMRLALVYGGQGSALTKFFLQFYPPDGATISCPYGKRKITVRPTWDNISRTTVYEMDGHRCDDLSYVSQAILLPILLYPNYDWSDALEKVEAPQG